MASEEDFRKHAEQLNIRSIIITMILGALGFLVALQWRDAIQQTIELVVPRGEGLAYTYLAAMIVTSIAVTAAYALTRLQKVDLVPGDKLRAMGGKLKKNRAKEQRNAPVV